MIKIPKRRNCKAPGCGASFKPVSIHQWTCCDECQHSYQQAIREKATEKSAEYARRARDKAAAKPVEKQKPKRHTTAPVKGRSLADEAQAAVNAYVCVRDADKPCISCGLPMDPITAGHFRTVGAARHLRFNTKNIHGQCVGCNGFLSGNVKQYRVGLANRHGAKLVEWLSSCYFIARYSDDYLRRIASVFRRRKKHLQNLRERNKFTSIG